MEKPESKLVIKICNQIKNAFGIDCSAATIDVKTQKYGKIMDIDEDVRQSIIYNLTQKHNIYSIGKFACWRNHTVLTDVIKDIYKVNKWIEQSKNMTYYNMKKENV